MKRTAVDSSMLASAGYDATLATLEIELRTGEVYAYFAVPRDVYQALLAASSKGDFFREHIDGVYPSARAAEAQGQ